MVTSKDANELLTRVSNPNVRGFSMNSCNYRSTKECIAWAKRLCRYRKDDYFVIDTSRNGNGPLDTEWCNPKGRALGETPTTNTDYEKCDRIFGLRSSESDGKCNGETQKECFGRTSRRISKK